MPDDNFCFGCGRWVGEQTAHKSGCDAAMNDPGPCEPDTSEVHTAAVMALLAACATVVGLAVVGVVGVVRRIL